MNVHFLFLCFCTTKKKKTEPKEISACKHLAAVIFINSKLERSELGLKFLKFLIKSIKRKYKKFSPQTCSAPVSIPLVTLDKSLRAKRSNPENIIILDCFVGRFLGFFFTIATASCTSFVVGIAIATSAFSLRKIHLAKTFTLWAFALPKIR